MINVVLTSPAGIYKLAINPADSPFCLSPLNDAHLSKTAPCQLQPQLPNMLRAGQADRAGCVMWPLQLPYKPTFLQDEIASRCWGMNCNAPTSAFTIDLSP